MIIAEYCAVIGPALHSARKQTAVKLPDPLLRNGVWPRETKLDEQHTTHCLSLPTLMREKIRPVYSCFKVGKSGNEAGHVYIEV